ncbi:hypothetical protein BpHYR1_029477 [Brachionus plicatilis]|uniref:Uncharacterized protein n=1 Tax=Brachionus plicatilis TaxID=10195 RepID=A0A3M7S2L8_BRAPC|nr:hypothetical protein BpHYR1_029477 [Brachionus plicatilis]
MNLIENNFVSENKTLLNSFSNSGRKKQKLNLIFSFLEEECLSGDKKFHSKILLLILNRLSSFKKCLKRIDMKLDLFKEIPF